MMVQLAEWRLCNPVILGSNPAGSKFRKDAPGVNGGLDDDSMSLTKLPL